MADTKQMITDLLSHLTFDQATIDVTESEEDTQVKITLAPEDSGVLIGYRGEKIDALQFVLNLMINQDNIQFKPVNVDINGYREKRYDTLRQMADTAATKAIESGREILLPPLPPNERRIMHIHLTENANVSTYSEGEASDRRIVVRPESV